MVWFIATVVGVDLSLLSTTFWDCRPTVTYMLWFDPDTPLVVRGFVIVTDCVRAIPRPLLCRRRTREAS